MGRWARSQLLFFLVPSRPPLGRRGVTRPQRCLNPYALKSLAVGPTRSWGWTNFGSIYRRLRLRPPAIFLISLFSYIEAFPFLFCGSLVPGSLELRAAPGLTGLRLALWMTYSAVLATAPGRPSLPAISVAPMALAKLRGRILGKVPARLTAWVLNCQPHDVSILVAARLLKQ
jgi:hypothetical protein